MLLQTFLPLNIFVAFALAAPSLVSQANESGTTNLNPVTVQVKPGIQPDRYTVTIQSNSDDNPNQQLDALIDTGSDLTWLMWEEADNCWSEGPRFKVDDQNCVDLGPFEMTYGAGNQVDGVLCQGDLTLMSTGQAAITFPQQVFGVVAKCSDENVLMPTALLGLARAPKKNPVAPNPIISRLPGLGYAPEVTAWFAADGKSGELTLGGINPAHSQSPPVYVGMYKSLDTVGAYELVTKILVDGKDVTGNLYLAQVDTGAQRMFIGYAGADLFYSKINVPKCKTQPGDGTIIYCIPCNALVPKVGFSFSISGTFTGTDFSGPWPIDFWKPSTLDQGQCEGSLRGYNGPSGTFLIPSTFMQGVTTTMFPGELAIPPIANQVGLALAKP